MSATTSITTLADRIDALLPQTQCTKCGFPGCRPYAEAIADGGARINRCPPGGADAIRQLANLLGVDPMPLDPAHGVEAPLRIAVIDPARCIGCALCLPACPVDAIVGARRRMHRVVDDRCTGCELCLAPCPMDCISMQEPTPIRTWSAADADRARTRIAARQRRLVRSPDKFATHAAESPLTDTGVRPSNTMPTIDRALIDAAIQRARARRAKV